MIISFTFYVLLYYTGIVRALPSAASVPVAEVTIDWYFADNPLVNGSGTTDENGQFIETSNYLGFHLQV
jgi:hypothetical protein